MTQLSKYQIIKNKLIRKCRQYKCNKIFIDLTNPQMPMVLDATHKPYFWGLKENDQFYFYRGNESSHIFQGDYYNIEIVCDDTEIKDAFNSLFQNEIDYCFTLSVLRKIMAINHSLLLDLKEHSIPIHYIESLDVSKDNLLDAINISAQYLDGYVDHAKSYVISPSCLTKFYSEACKYKIDPKLVHERAVIASPAITYYSDEEIFKYVISLSNKECRMYAIYLSGINTLGITKFPRVFKSYCDLYEAYLFIIGVYNFHITPCASKYSDTFSLNQERIKDYQCPIGDYNICIPLTIKHLMLNFFNGSEALTTSFIQLIDVNTNVIQITRNGYNYSPIAYLFLKENKLWKIINCASKLEEIYPVIIEFCLKNNITC